MKTKNLIVVCLLVLGMSASVYAEVKNYFGNGVGNTQADAEKSSYEVEKLTGIKMEKPLYNSTYGVIADVFEVARQSLELDEFYKLFIKFMDAGSKEAQIIQSTMQKYQDKKDQKIALKASRIYSLIDKTKKESMKGFLSSPMEQKERLLEIGFTNFEIGRIEAMSSISETVDKLAGAYKIIYDKLNFENSNQNTDLKLMAKRLQSIIDNGGKINIIAHSQGNLMVNDALKYYVKNVNSQNAKMLSVATPDSNVLGVTNGKNYITLKEDVASYAFVGSYPGNFSNYSDFPEYKDLPWYTKYNPFSPIIWSMAKPGSVLARNESYYGSEGLSGHNFTDCYLKNNSKSREWIKKWYLVNFKELGGKLESDKEDLEIKKRENLWLGDIELEGYGKNVPQRKSIKFDSRAFYSSNVKPEKRKVQVCYALSKSPYWRYSDFVRGPKYSSKVFTTKESSQKISDVSFMITKDIPLGDYYMLVNINCHQKVKETDYIEDQVKFAKITVIDDEVEDVYTTEPRVSGSGTKINIKNTMVYRGSTPDIGDVYNLYYISDQPKFSTAQRFIAVKVRMGWAVRQRRTVSATINIAKLPPKKYYIWVVTQTPDLSHDDDTSNNHFRMSFVVQKKE